MMAMTLIQIEHWLKAQNPVMLVVGLFVLFIAFKFIKGVIQRLSLFLVMGFAYLWFSSHTFRQLLDKLKILAGVQINF